MTELMMSKAIGCKEGDIMFSSNDTPEEEFKYANEIGGIINLDDITHIESVERAVGYIPKVISCRYNPGGVFKISNDIMDNPGDAKYGMTTEQIFEAFKILKEKGAEEFGIHAFLASNTVTNEYYPMLAKEMFEMAVKLQKETGAHVKFINLSGGVGIAYKPDQTPNDIREIGEGVRKVYEEVLVPAGMGDVAIYTEMGRFMMGPYGCLVTKTIADLGVDMLAAGIGNIHGKYPANWKGLSFETLDALLIVLVKMWTQASSYRSPLTSLDHRQVQTNWQDFYYIWCIRASTELIMRQTRACAAVMRLHRTF